MYRSKKALQVRTILKYFILKPHIKLPDKETTNNFTWAPSIIIQYMYLNVLAYRLIERKNCHELKHVRHTFFSSFLYQKASFWTNNWAQTRVFAFEKGLACRHFKCFRKGEHFASTQLFSFSLKRKNAPETQLSRAQLKECRTTCIPIWNRRNPRSRL